jgi:hypothetical protein
MKTPYDTLVRLQKRTVDEVKLSISIEVTHIAEVQLQQSALVQEVEAECAAAAQDWSLSTTAYLRDRAARSARLVQTRKEHEQQLDRLREEASQAYGALRVTENAAQAFAKKMRLAREARDQAESDDLSNARRLLKANRAKFTAARKQRDDTAH